MYICNLDNLVGKAERILFNSFVRSFGVEKVMPKMHHRVGRTKLLCLQQSSEYSLSIRQMTLILRKIFANDFKSGKCEHCLTDKYLESVGNKRQLQIRSEERKNKL
jgi:hypothetical protein